MEGRGEPNGVMGKVTSEGGYKGKAIPQKSGSSESMSVEPGTLSGGELRGKKVSGKRGRPCRRESIGCLKAFSFPGKFNRKMDKDRRASPGKRERSRAGTQWGSCSEEFSLTGRCDAKGESTRQKRKGSGGETTRQGSKRLSTIKRISKKGTW